jgi:hypothetical protein
MKLLEAHVNGNPRQVNTKYGEKAVMDVVTTDGQEIAIWRPAGDVEVMGRRNGERVSIALDSKGKASLVEHCSTKPQQAQIEQERQQAITSAVAQPNRSAEIADYIQRLGKLYSHCLDTAARMPKTVELETPHIKDVATTLFIQAVRHFDL